MTVIIEHDNGLVGRHGTSEETLDRLEGLPQLLISYIQAGICVYKLELLPNREGTSWV